MEKEAKVIKPNMLEIHGVHDSFLRLSCFCIVDTHLKFRLDRFPISSLSLDFSLISAQGEQPFDLREVTRVARSSGITDFTTSSCAGKDMRSDAARRCKHPHSSRCPLGGRPESVDSVWRLSKSAAAAHWGGINVAAAVAAKEGNATAWGR